VLSSPTVNDGRPTKVLIADDDRTVRTLLSDILRELGHAVVEAEDGTAAVELCSRERPDIVILDFLMPKLSGLDALKAMRDRGMTMPALLLTAISDSSLRAVEGFDAPDAILGKPFKKKTIEKAIAKALQRE